MNLRRLLFAALTATALHADNDVDELLRDLDLSRLQPSRAAEPVTEDRRIFEDVDHLPPEIRELPPLEPGEIVERHLPAADLLVVPNPASLPAAYALLARGLQEADLTPQSPLTLLLHADDRVSVGIPVTYDESKPLPLGTDLSARPGQHLLLQKIELTEARRSEAELARAALALRREALRRGLTSLPRDLLLFPADPPHVIVALPVDIPRN